MNSKLISLDKVKRRRTPSGSLVVDMGDLQNMIEKAKGINADLDIIIGEMEGHIADGNMNAVNSLFYKLDDKISKLKLDDINSQVNSINNLICILTSLEIAKKNTKIDMELIGELADVNSKIRAVMHKNVNYGEDSLRYIQDHTKASLKSMQHELNDDNKLVDNYFKYFESATKTIEAKIVIVANAIFRVLDASQNVATGKLKYNKNIKEANDIIVSTGVESARELLDDLLGRAKINNNIVDANK